MSSVASESVLNGYVDGILEVNCIGHLSPNARFKKSSGIAWSRLAVSTFADSESPPTPEQDAIQALAVDGVDCRIVALG
eukprot:5985276-Amphidinium_carterae.1